MHHWICRMCVGMLFTQSAVLPETMGICTRINFPRNNSSHSTVYNETARLPKCVVSSWEIHKQQCSNQTDQIYLLLNGWFGWADSSSSKFICQLIVYFVINTAQIASLGLSMADMGIRCLVRSSWTRKYSTKSWCSCCDESSEPNRFRR